MTVLAVVKGAGSAGGTTSAVTLAALLAEQGRTVRLIDLDRQANASSHLGVDEAKPTVGDVLLRRATVAEAELATKVPGLTLLPATAELAAVEIELTRTVGGDQRLRGALAAASTVDATIIDCHGSLSLLPVAATVVADHVITVTQPTLKELAGVPAVDQFVAEVRDAYNPGVTLAAVIPCNVPAVNRGKVYAMALDLLRETFGALVTPPVRHSPRVPEAYSHQVPLHLWAPREGVTEDYRVVLADLQDRQVL